MFYYSTTSLDFFENLRITHWVSSIYFSYSISFTGVVRLTGQILTKLLVFYPPLTRTPGMEKHFKYRITNLHRLLPYNDFDVPYICKYVGYDTWIILTICFSKKSYFQSSAKLVSVYSQNKPLSFQSNVLEPLSSTS